MARHHYVAKAILKNFCFSGETTYYLHKESFPSEATPRNIGTIFTRRHYNSLKEDDGAKNDALEKFFAYELDDFIPRWTSIFEKSLDTGKILFSDNAEKFRFIQFFYNHMKRSPDFIEPIVEKVSKEVFNRDLVTEFEKKYRPLNDFEKQKILSDKFQKLVTNNSRVVNLSRQSEEILETLASMKVIVATPNSRKKQFIVGANPVIRFEDHPFQPLGETGVELWTTLTPKIAVGFVASPIGEDILMLQDDKVRKMNVQLTKTSSRIAGRSEALLQSLAKCAW